MAKDIDNVIKTAASAEELTASSKEIGGIVSSIAGKSQGASDKAVAISENAKNIMGISEANQKQTQKMFEETDTRLKISIEIAKAADVNNKSSYVLNEVSKAKASSEKLKEDITKFKI